MKSNPFAIGLGATAGILTSYALLLRARQLRWGGTNEETSQELPGDDIVLAPDLTATRSITIRAPAEHVWPWIAQLGQRRAGFYSYDFLENLAGCEIHSADRIVPEWQDIQVGDTVKLHPRLGLQAAVVEPGLALVLSGNARARGESTPPYDFSWAFVLRAQANGTSRLIVRERYGYTRPWAFLMAEPFALVSFLMSQKMLRGIRDRVENEGAATQHTRRCE